MPYPVEMQASLRKVQATRQQRLEKEFRRLELSEKSEILKNYHPDFRESGKTGIPFGPSKGDPVPNELAELITSPSRLEPESVDLNKIDFETDILVIGGGGGGATAALTAAEKGARERWLGSQTEPYALRYRNGLSQIPETSPARGRQ
ncbi:MAG: FAD-binding protein [Desulfobacteraceae bacterium]|nr:MAG: FAD-binding protein [Desulfobacteraceae bacterium]